MKKTSFAAAFIFFVAVCSAQNSDNSKNVFVRENIDLTKSYNAEQLNAGLRLLGGTKSGYKIYLNNENGKSSILVKSPEGNPVTVGRRKYIQSVDGLVCMECITVRRGKSSEENCWEVTCTSIDKAAAGSGRGN